MSPKGINGVGLASVAIGSILLYGGIRGYSILKAFQNIIQGHNPNENQSVSLLTNASDITGGSNSSAGLPLGGSTKAIGERLAAARGWTKANGQFQALDWIWTRESGWRTTATNPSSGAYGIPQALPASKMASAGSDWKTNPATQIEWGLGYIASTYGDPIKAKAFWQANGWY